MKTPNWVTACGDQLPLANMSDEHVHKVVLYLTLGDGEHGLMLRTGCNGFSNAEWLRLCAVELTRRQRK
jgi:hypothetical protein